MGFIDWIQEPAVERIGQFRDRQRGYYDPPPKPTFRCSMCSQEFQTTRELLSHSRQSHPLSLPLLSLGDQLLLSTTTLRVSINPDEILIEHGSEIKTSVDGHDYYEVSRTRLTQLIAEKEEGRVDIRLKNTRACDDSHATSDYRINFRIPAKSDLLAIDKIFTETMTILPIAVSSANTFWETCADHRNSTASSDYANALSNYIIGMAIKQGDQMKALSFDRFKDKFLDALEILRNFDTPLAIGITEIIRFNLNDFTNWPTTIATLPDLGAAASFFQSPGGALNSPAKQRRAALSQTSQCPVDDLTERTVKATIMILEKRYNSKDLETLLPPLLKWSPLGEYDRQKIHVLMAAMYIGKENITQAEPHLRAVRSDPNLKEWVESHLPSF
jgi:hypothetical protein